MYRLLTILFGLHLSSSLFPSLAHFRPRYGIDLARYWPPCPIPVLLYSINRAKTRWTSMPHYTALISFFHHSDSEARKFLRTVIIYPRLYVNMENHHFFRKIRSQTYFFYSSLSRQFILFHLITNMPLISLSARPLHAVREAKIKIKIIILQR